LEISHWHLGYYKDGNDIEAVGFFEHQKETLQRKSLGAPLISRNGRPALCLLRPGQEFHYTGTYRIGNDPLTAAANPTLTTVALAIRTADHILQQRKD
jgi:hypothetical protein